MMLLLLKCRYHTFNLFSHYYVAYKTLWRKHITKPVYDGRVTFTCQTFYICKNSGKTMLFLLMGKEV